MDAHVQERVAERLSAALDAIVAALVLVGDLPIDVPDDALDAALSADPSVMDARVVLASLLDDLAGQGADAHTLIRIDEVAHAYAARSAEAGYRIGVRLRRALP